MPSAFSRVAGPDGGRMSPMGVLPGTNASRAGGIDDGGVAGRDAGAQILPLARDPISPFSSKSALSASPVSANSFRLFV